ncbi:retinoic acid-induced protein 1 [Alosa sapidissima]|uniref:retinoic acid-induced protein 1 n=1 Tax=Alosa sapidissima TaxID=34773 RepID=UPI001C08C1FC|nr:retinoic acid-induced protein 1 [Alosa sapidissima]XP_041943241.1 retinoic acid-induced protein 1 [Alosa sapidissima]XP_041943242.1 retinoic acid-induced protein 1 [Alosa sapidissima]
MEPLNQSNLIHCQDSLLPALDLSMNFKKSHISSRSTEALVKKPTWCDLGTAGQSPMGFSGVRAEHSISQPCPQTPTQDDPKVAHRKPFDTSPRLGSQSRSNGHLPASHFPSVVYNCKAELPKKDMVRNADQEVPRHSSRHPRVNHQNGLASHLPMPKAAGKNAMGSLGCNSNQTNSSTPWVSKSVCPSKGYKTVVESSVGTPPKLPSHNVSYQAITSQGHKVSPIHKKVMVKHIAEVRHSSSPVYIESDDSDVVEVPVSNYSKNTPSPQVSTSPQLSACAQTHHNNHTNTNSTGSSGECGDDAMYIWASEYSTSGVFAAQPPEPTSSNASSDEDIGAPCEVTTVNAQPTPKQQKTRSPGQAKASAGKVPPAKRKRKKHRQAPSSSSSMFAPQEPEIKLKYANLSQKEEKKDSRADANFCPYVRVEVRGVSACTVVNWQEEEEALRKKGRQRSAAPLRPAAQATGTVPSTSCLRLGRLNADSRGMPTQTCSLCGWPANSMGLGDLHGPYYPSKCNPPSKLLDQWDPREVQNTECAGASQGSVENSPGNPSKRPRRDWAKDDGSEAAAVLVADRNSGERWLHEDCSIWSAGVFLIKGRLYGLEEAIRLAEETVCSCCHKVGATLGCFFKGCCNKYHYICALQSGCLLSEDNFSMRCPKHKNKSHRPVTR